MARNISNQYIINASLIASLITIVIYHLVGYTLLAKGFTITQFALFSLVYGLTYLIVLSTTIFFFITSYVAEAIKVGDKLKKWVFVTGKILLFTIIISVVVDGFYTYLIDNSLAKAFAEKLVEVSELQGKKADPSVNGYFKNLSSFLQNMGVNIIAIILSCFIAVPLAYSSGKKASMKTTY